MKSGWKARRTTSGLKPRVGRSRRSTGSFGVTDELDVLLARAVSAEQSADVSGRAAMREADRIMRDLGHDGLFSIAPV